MAESYRVLVVDGNNDDRALSVFLLTKALAGAEVVEVPNALVFAERLTRGDFAAVVTEFRLDWGDGFQVLDAVRSLRPACPVIFFTAHGSEAVAADGLRRGLAGYVIKGSAGFLALAETVRAAIGAAASSHRLEELSRGLDRLTDELALGTFAATQQGTVAGASPALARMLGVAGVDAVGGRQVSAFFQDPKARQQVADTLARGEVIRGFEAEGRREDGTPVWLRLAAWPVADGSGFGYQGVLEDVTARRAAERELAERASALSRSSDELQEVAYAISHDLQEPLQLIARYTRLLAKSPAGKDAERYTGTIQQCADRMQTMIDDVLAYARVGTRGKPFAPVDFGEALKKATANLKAAVEESGGEVICEAMPTLDADGAQVVQLFQNLIGNALKFHRSEPHVKVLAIDEGEAWTFAVADNGIGIPPQHLERIFGMFQRLHTASEYPGTGIGLAICKRIVERHGGKIWAVSEPGKGSTFFFTVPKHLGGPAAAAAGEPEE